jgi:hypothetical protein
MEMNYVATSCVAADHLCTTAKAEENSKPEEPRPATIYRHSSEL